MYYYVIHKIKMEIEITLIYLQGDSIVTELATNVINHLFVHCLIMQAYTIVIYYFYSRNCNILTMQVNHRDFSLIKW